MPRGWRLQFGKTETKTIWRCGVRKKPACQTSAAQCSSSPLSSQAELTTVQTPKSPTRQWSGCIVGNVGTRSDKERSRNLKNRDVCYLLCIRQCCHFCGWSPPGIATNRHGFTWANCESNIFELSWVCLSSEGPVLFANAGDRRSDMTVTPTVWKAFCGSMRNFEVLEHVYLPSAVLSPPLTDPRILLTPSGDKTKEQCDSSLSISSARQHGGAQRAFVEHRFDIHCNSSSGQKWLFFFSCKFASG